jgi:hypothetical protein
MPALDSCWSSGTNSLLENALDDDAIKIPLEHSRRELARLLDGIYLPRELLIDSKKSVNSCAKTGFSRFSRTI